MFTYPGGPTSSRGEGTHCPWDLSSEGVFALLYPDHEVTGLRDERRYEASDDEIPAFPPLHRATFRTGRGVGDLKVWATGSPREETPKGSLASCKCARETRPDSST
jgi:hypothetical protein